MRKSRVLVVDDEPKMSRILEIMLQKMGHDVVVAADGRSALARAQTTPLDLVVTDLRMPEMNGIELLNALRERGLAMPVIIMTAYGTVESAVDAMKHGAYDYILRPFDIDTVEIVIKRALSIQRVQDENQFLRSEIEKGWEEFIGRSPTIQHVYELIRSVAPGQTSVFITGESGTGKELAARAIHRASPRRQALFVPVNCAAIPAEMLESELFGHMKGAFTGAHRDRLGKFALADGGTIFLDEIAEMRPYLQAKLLRALQENSIERLGSDESIAVDVRVIAATNQNVEQALQNGTLREDLFYRLNVFSIEMPPLRARREDIPLLVNYFLEKQSTKLGTNQPTVSVEVLALLQQYSWPGNVRELGNVIERALVLNHGQTIEPQHLPKEIASTPPSQRQTILPEVADPKPTTLSLLPALTHVEKTLITQALHQTGGNKPEAARLLNVSERTLRYKVKKYRLS